MKFFVDTAKIEDIKKANEMGVICGVTTNPSLIAKEGGRSQEDVLKEIASIVDGPISGEVKATTVDAEGMIAEGREIAKLHENMVVKIPMTVEGLKATKVLASEGIKCNVTLIFSANQALLAARAGAAYVSPFLGRLDDISQPGIDLIRDIAEIFSSFRIDQRGKIIAADLADMGNNPFRVTDFDRNILFSLFHNVRYILRRNKISVVNFGADTLHVLGQFIYNDSSACRRKTIQEIQRGFSDCD